MMNRKMTSTEAAAILESEAEFLYSQDEPYCRQAFKMAVEALQERKTGKWIVSTDCEGKRRTNTCPFCGDKRETSGYTPKYCEECGARLEAGDADSD